MKPERAPKQYANLWERGSTGVFAVVETNSDGKHYLHYILKDHLGSWTTITDSDGAVEQELSYDAWDNLRDPNTWILLWSDPIYEEPMFDRGYTGHEHIPAFGLINMNGRCYDHVMSSFLSVDAYVQSPDNSQNFNRYAYCLNNPLKYTDPSGEFMYEDGDLVCIFAPFGRIRPMATEQGTRWRTYYSLTDHLGNVRAEFVAHDSGQPELVQQTDYYPFGYTLRRNDFGSQHPNRRLFGGKELQPETLAGNTLDWYDFEARMYDPVIGRFLTTDPMAEKYFSLTPYGYCVNNPMNYIDPSGKDVEISIDKENKTILVRANFYYNSSQLEHGDMFNINIKKEFQNAMNIWSENIKTAFSSKQFDGFSVNVQFEWKEVDIGDAIGIDAIQIIQQAAEADPIGNSIVHVEKTNPRSEVKGTKHLVANMEKAAADPYMFFGIDGYDGNTAMHEIGHFFGLRDRYDPNNPEHAPYIEGDLMTIGSYRRNAEEPFIRVLNYNKLTPEERKTILINKQNREPK